MNEALKLFTIGDSISQGFMSLAAARTDLCYSTIVARELGWKDHKYAKWEKGGHPFDLETFFRDAAKRVGANVGGVLDYVRVFESLSRFLDEVEDYYERGKGRYDLDYTDVREQMYDCFHNVAIRGFNISDAWTVTHALCDHVVTKGASSNRDNFLRGPSASFFRTAARVLNPQPVKDPHKNHFTTIDWLEFHARNGGVENVFLWLGANNALGTITEMQVTPTNGNMQMLPKLSPGASTEEKLRQYQLYEDNYQEGFNLWHIKDFENEYRLLLEYIDQALVASPKTRVFVGTVPYVTIAPLARGMGKEFFINGKRYFEYYTYFPFDDCKLENYPGLPALRLTDICFIDENIRKYNECIRRLVAERNDQLELKKVIRADRYFIVDMAGALEEMAFRRNNGDPRYEFPEYMRNRYPLPDTRYYERHHRKGTKGGIFSLDGVHPTAIGQGLIAYEFLKVMQMAGVRLKTMKDGLPLLDWAKIYDDDKLYTDPLPLVSDLFEHDQLKLWLVKIMGLLKKLD